MTYRLQVWIQTFDSNFLQYWNSERKKKQYFDLTKLKLIRTFLYNSFLKSYPSKMFVLLGAGGNQSGIISSSHGERTNAAEYPLRGNPRKWKPKVLQGRAEIYQRRTKELCMSKLQFVCIVNSVYNFWKK